MKRNAIIILVTMLISISAFAGEKNHSSIQTPNPQTNILQKLPYSSTGNAQMQLVISKDEYSLYKCPSNMVTNFPGNNITGNKYNYFIYKNGKFHLTVNENNKKDIYNFLTK